MSVLLGGCFLSKSVLAATAVLFPFADTTLQESNPDHNLGGSTTVVVGTNAQEKRHRALLRFDPAGVIPADAIVLSARLDLVMTADATGTGSPLDIEVHRFLTGWNEGNKSGNQGAPASSGEPTWNRLAHPDVMWSSPGASAGVEFLPTASATATVGGLKTWSWSGELARDVAFWLTNGAANFGWILVSTSEGAIRTSRRFASREDAANRPALTVEYELPSLRLPLPDVANGWVTFLVHVPAGRSVVLEYREDLKDGDWQVAAPFVAEPQSRDALFTTPAHRPRSFYRLRWAP